MALTREKLLEVAVLKELQPDQITAITNLSKTDEDEVINEKTAEAYGYVDKAVKEVLGVDKPHGQMTSKWVANELKKLKEAGNGTTELQAEITKLKQEKSDLEQKIKEGDTSGALKQQLTDRETQIEDLRTKIKKMEADHEKAIGEKSQELSLLKEDHEFSAALSGVNYVSESIIPENTRNRLIKAAKAEVREEFKIDYQDGKMIFRDKTTDKIITDPDNLSEPMSAKTMLFSRLKGVIDEKKSSSGGGGGKGGGGENDNKATLESLSGVKTQKEAETVIRTYLNAKGLAAGTQAYQAEQMKIWTDNKIDQLDIQ